MLDEMFQRHASEFAILFAYKLKITTEKKSKNMA